MKANKPALYVACFAMLLLLGCGGTYVDDRYNFERALNFNPPPGTVISHSIYWQSSHFTDEHCFYLAIQNTNSSALLATLTNLAHVVPSITNHIEVPSLVLDRPGWFAADTNTQYQVWTSTNDTFGILHDAKTGTTFVYGQIL